MSNKSTKGHAKALARHAALKYPQMEVAAAWAADCRWFDDHPDRGWRARSMRTQAERATFGLEFPGGRKYIFVRRGAGPGNFWASFVGLPFHLDNPPDELTPGQLDALIARIVANEQVGMSGELHEFEGIDIPGWEYL